jgi:hypothetical protein
MPTPDCRLLLRAPSVDGRRKNGAPKRHVDSTKLYDAVYVGDAERVELL